MLLGTTRAEVGGSEWATRHGLRTGTAPAVDLDAAVALHDVVRALVSERVVHGVHDCADGGLAVAVAEMAIAGGTGAALTLDAPAVEWFSESASRVVLSVGPERVDEVLGRAAGAGRAGRGDRGGRRSPAHGARSVRGGPHRRHGGMARRHTPCAGERTGPRLMLHRSPRSGTQPVRSFLPTVGSRPALSVMGY